MKKIFLIPLVFLLSNCEFKMQESTAGDNVRFPNCYKCEGSFKEDYSHTVIEKDDMEYLVVFKKDGTTQTGYAVAISNLTLDRLEVAKTSLEIELLNRQLNDIRNKKW